jgi:hypothetical protein
MSEPLHFTELLYVRIDSHWNFTFCSNLLAAIASWLAEGRAYLLDLCNSTDIFYVDTAFGLVVALTSLYFTGRIALFQTVLSGGVSFLMLRKYIVSLPCSLRSS